MSFELKNISFAYNGKKLLSEISIGVNAGELHCLVGKNGAGKSTLLKIMTGDLSPHTGSLSLDGREIRSFSLEDLAKKRAVMLQETRVDSPFTVGEVCLLGRSPYHGGKESLEDHKITKKSLKLVDNWILKNKIIQNTSGGEKQRTHLARVLAQIWDKNGFSSKYLLLDEPLSSLDIQHQIQVLKILSLLTKKGLGVFIILHDLNLASAFATKISILKDGKILQTGVPKEVLNSKNLEEAYGIKVKTLYDPDLDQVLIHPYHQRKQKEKKMVKRRFSQEELKTNWETYKKENPRKRIRDAAHEMGVSEMELLATGLGESVIRLKENWKEIIAEVGCLGYVMALTRNEACVHERKGVYQNISENSGVGLVVGEDIVLSFLEIWICCLRKERT
jgi:ABC-type hemin transport system ATPase subunit